MLGSGFVCLDLPSTLWSQTFPLWRVGLGKRTLVLLVQPEVDKRPQLLIHTHFHFLQAAHHPNCSSPYLPSTASAPGGGRSAFSCPCLGSSDSKWWLISLPGLLSQHGLSRLHHHAVFGGWERSFPKGSYLSSAYQYLSEIMLIFWRVPVCKSVGFLLVFPHVSENHSLSPTSLWLVYSTQRLCPGSSDSTSQDQPVASKTKSFCFSSLIKIVICTYVMFFRSPVRTLANPAARHGRVSALQMKKVRQKEGN